MKSSSECSIFIFTLLISFLSFGCVSTPSAHLVDQKLIEQYLPGTEQIVIFTCHRCQCFLDELPKIENSKSLFKNVKFITDTKCTNSQFQFDHLDRRQIDSISTKFYNVVLLKREGSFYRFRIVETEESPRLLGIMKNFFL